MWGDPLWEPLPTLEGEESPPPLPQRQSGRLKGTNKVSPKTGFLRNPILNQIAKSTVVQFGPEQPSTTSPWFLQYIRGEFRPQQAITWVKTIPVTTFLSQENQSDLLKVTPSITKTTQHIQQVEVKPYSPALLTLLSTGSQGGWGVSPKITTPYYELKLTLSHPC